MVSRSPVSSAETRSTAPSTTMPWVPSMEMMSPSCSTRSLPSICTTFSAASIWKRSTPQTQGVPMPRAITAAWLVLPPWLVRMPSAATMPFRSSGLVSQRTRMTLWPSAERATASSLENTTSPTAAPGLAFRPVASASYFLEESNCGCRSWSSCAGSMRLTASSRVIRPSSTISMAMRRAAVAVRLPTRVWSIQSLPCSMVNSISHISR